MAPGVKHPGGETPRTRTFARSGFVDRSAHSVSHLTTPLLGNHFAADTVWNMRAQVLLLPKDLRPTSIVGRTAVVFDVLRATTTMTAALAAGVREIRIFPDIDSTRSAAEVFTGSKLLCGERRCLPPIDFQLGNSPGKFNRDDHAGVTVFMCTTNGTPAILSTAGAFRTLIGSLVNCASLARRIRQDSRDITLLCAGTESEPAMEDVIGCGALLDSLGVAAQPENDLARMALHLFTSARGDLPAALRDTAGGRNIIAAGLEADIDFCARLNALDAVGVCVGSPPIVIPMSND